MNPFLNYTYGEFIEEWGKELDKAMGILKALKSYNGESERFNRYKFLDPECLESSQKDWVWLLARLENPVEYEFFKSYWIPLNEDEYDLYLDLKSNPLRIISASYYGNEPYTWFEIPFGESVEQLILDLDYDEVLDHYFEKKGDAYMKEFWDIADHGNELGQLGLIDPEPVAPDELFGEKPFEILENGKNLCIKGISSLSVDLLGRETDISLGYFFSHWGKPLKISLPNIKALVYHLRSIGYKGDPVYDFGFKEGDTECFCHFEDEVLEISSLSKPIKDRLIIKLLKAKEDNED
jgi:hypothetical protein